jgi:hypothetical protein
MNTLPGSAFVLCCAVLTACGDVSGPLPLHAPSGLTTTQLSFTTIRVSWSRVPGAAYLLQRASAAAPGTFVQIGRHLLTASQFDDPDVTAGVSYSYRVAAVLADTSDFSATATFSTSMVCPAPASPQSVLVDASHDGGVWWFPQVAPFKPGEDHQGLSLADTLRAKGYVVDELARGDTVDRDRLFQYAVVIRAAKFDPYMPSELLAYDDFVECPRTLLLLGEFFWPGDHDELAEQLGIPLDSAVTGTVTTFEAHAITAGVDAFPYIAGSVIWGDVPASVHVLGWLATGEAVMGVLDGHAAKVFWIGDTNGLETVPQPLVNNLVAWGF